MKNIERKEVILHYIKYEEILADVLIKYFNENQITNFTSKKLLL